MTVTIKLQKPDGTLIANFAAEDKKSIAQLAKEHWIEFPTACGVGMCGICLCKIVSWQEHIQIDKISPPIKPLERNEDGSFKQVFACVWGIQSDSIKSAETYEVILEKNM